MSIRFGYDKIEWNNWLRRFFHTEFIQSWEWGEFQQRVGRQVIRLQAVEGDEVVWQGHGFEHRLGLGLKYLYLPRLRPEIINEVMNYCHDRDYSFIRIEPLAEPSAINYQPASRRGRLSAIPNIQPQHTLILDLSLSEDELLSAMHPKTRYNIHLAERKGVVIRKEKNSEIFIALNAETVKRDGFHSHPEAYYREMVKMPICRRLTAHYGSQAVASNIWIGFGDTFTYLHGASSSLNRNVMAPYFLQWEGIRLAKSLGYRYYDFWGIAPPAVESAGGQTTCLNGFTWETDHPWTGVTRFKVGFGGTLRSYPGAVDIVLKPVIYKMYKVGRRL